MEVVLMNKIKYIMKKYLLATILSFMLFGLVVHNANAQMMGFYGSQPDNSAIQSQQQEEQEGKKLLGQVQNKTTTCQKLTDTDFEKIGEYFMGQAIGNTSQHISMNNMMKGMMGEQGEEQMHIAWGKRGSGCNTNAQFAPTMMGGGGNPMMGYGGWNNMMGGWNGFGILGWIPMLLFWVLLILGVVALFRYLGGLGKRSDESKAPLDILKERYAKGEINKKEFEEMKKDLR